MRETHQTAATAKFINAYLTAPVKEFPGSFRMRIIHPIITKDGSVFSVQASEGHYCSPRTANGPYTQVEVMTDVPVPGHRRQQKSEGICAYADINVIARVINAHGGIDFEATKTGNRMLKPEPKVEEVEEVDGGAYWYC